MLDWTEVAGFVTGAVCVWLAVRRNIWTFPVGMANNVFFWILFIRAGLFADAWLQVVYLALAAAGWYAWLRGGPGHTALEVRRTPRAGWLWVGIFVLAATGVVYALLTSHTSSTVPLGDATTTALSLGAQIMLNRKWIGNWALWITADVIYIWLYLTKGLVLTAVLYAGFLVMCLWGRRQWSRHLEQTSSGRLATPAAVWTPVSG